jgi:hypothetical protein
MDTAAIVDHPAQARNLERTAEDDLSRRREEVLTAKIESPNMQTIHLAEVRVGHGDSVGVRR